MSAGHVYWVIEIRSMDFTARGRLNAPDNKRGKLKEKISIPTGARGIILYINHGAASARAIVT